MSVDPFISAMWKDDIVPTLTELIKIPIQSPDYDEAYFTNGLVEKVMDFVVTWIEKQNIQGLTLEKLTAPQRTPFLHIDVAASNGGKGCIACYGHLDRMPPCDNWSPGLGPYTPVIRDGRLYGRGTSDDSYAVFLAICALKSLQQKKKPHGRCHLLIEFAEESDHVVDGKSDLEFWLGELKPKLGESLDLMIALDAGGADYTRIWNTDSLRGYAGGVVDIAFAQDGVHSGVGGGVVPDPMQVIRILLDRLQDASTGAVKLASLNVPVREDVVAKLNEGFGHVPLAEYLEQFKFLSPTPPLPGIKTTVDAILATTRKPSITVTGLDCMPSVANGGNVIRGKASFKLSVRLPPGADPAAVTAEIKRTVEADPPFGAKITARMEEPAAGWEMSSLSPELSKALNDASMATFGKAPGFYGCGGSIPFITFLAQMFPKTQLMVTGVLGPGGCNAHCADEFMVLEFAEQICNCVALIMTQMSS